MVLLFSFFIIVTPYFIFDIIGLFTHLFVTLALPKKLPFGNEKKSILSFCISLIYS